MDPETWFLDLWNLNVKFDESLKTLEIKNILKNLASRIL